MTRSTGGAEEGETSRAGAGSVKARGVTRGLVGRGALGMRESSIAPGAGAHFIGSRGVSDSRVKQLLGGWQGRRAARIWEGCNMLESGGIYRTLVFDGEDQRGAVAQKADLVLTSWKGTDLRGVNFRGSDMRCATFDAETDLSAADLSGADLRASNIEIVVKRTGLTLDGALVDAPPRREQEPR